MYINIIVVYSSIVGMRYVPVPSYMPDASNYYSKFKTRTTTPQIQPLSIITLHTIITTNIIIYYHSTS